MENIELKGNNNPKEFNWDLVGLDFGNWDDEKLWALELPTEEMDIRELLWHLDVPFWENDLNERWTITPRDVINSLEGTESEQAKTENVDLSYPIDVMKNHGRLLVLDGLHRLAKAFKEGQTTVKVRIMPRERFSEIANGEPIELPS